jgi:hypothetical protein
MLGQISRQGLGLFFVLAFLANAAGASEGKSTKPIRHVAGDDAAPTFKKVFIIILENTSAQTAMKQPYLSSLSTRGAYLNQFFAMAHPSLPNYFAMTSASTHGVTNDNTTNLNVANIADLLEAKGKTWKSYNDNYPGNCFAGDKGKYARRHQPFIGYDDIRTKPARCARIVNSSQLAGDVEKGTLPEFSFYVPNTDNDGHDTGVKFADNWLKTTFDPYFNDPRFMQDMLVVVTFDEDDGSGPNQIYAVLFGTSVVPNSTSNTHYNVYNLLRTIEDVFGLGTLGLNDSTASPITGIWKSSPSAL